MIRCSTVKQIHSILSNNSPKNLLTKFKVNKRKTAAITLISIPKTTKSQNNYLYQGLKEYNKLPLELKQLSYKKIKHKIKIHYLNNNDT